MWGSPLSTLFLLCAAAFVSWPVLGLTAALIIFVGGLLILLLHHIYNLSLLFHWLRDPSSKTVPQGSGSWEYVFSYMQRLLKWQHTSELGLSKALDRFQQAVAAFPDAVVMLDDNDEIAWAYTLPRVLHLFDFFSPTEERDFDFGVFLKELCEDEVARGRLLERWRSVPSSASRFEH